MKKLLVLVAIFTVICSSAFAQRPETELNKIQVYVSENSTNAKVTTAVGVTTIYPGIDRILGVQVWVLDTATASERIVALYDNSAVDATTTTLFGECEAETGNSPAEIWYPYPRKLDTGLIIAQGANTRVIVYYTRY